MRALPAAAVAGLVAVLVAAGVATAGTEPIARHTAADMKHARQLVLGVGDLGSGWVAERGAPGSGAPAASPLRCTGYEPDLSGLVETGTAAGASLSFDDGTAFYSVGSAATVMKTPRMTAAAWARSIRPEIVACFRNAFVRGLQLGSSAGKGAAPLVRFGGSSSFEPPVTASRKAGFRLDASILFREEGATPLPIVIEVLFLAQGRRLAFASIASLGRQPPAALERIVAGRLATRLGRTPAPTA